MNQSVADMHQRSAILLIGIFILIGFALRCLAASGGLWTDEAWSLVYAQQAGDALGVLTRINHDNNHHLNSWWLQLVGPVAPPMLMRGLSIITSSATILVAALIGSRRNRPTGIIAAALFALSPIMVVYGSEARGYAPMMLALMIMIWRIDVWFEDRSVPKPALFLAFCTALGTLAHLTMLPGVVMLAVWIFVAEAQTRGLLKSAKQTADLLAPALAISVLSLCIVTIIAARSATGLQVGGYIPFMWPQFALAISNLLTFSVGIGYAWDISIWMILAIATISLAMFITRWTMPRERKWFYAILILTMPAVVAVLNLGNSQYPRYYLPAAAATLLLLAEWIGQLTTRQSLSRIGAVGILTLLLGSSLVQNYQLIVSQRGHPEHIVAAIAKAAPAGANVTIAFVRTSAMLKVAAAGRRYSLNIMQAQCGASNFHFVAGVVRESRSHLLPECGPSMRLIAFGDVVGPSGESWSLYHQQALPRPIAAVSSALSRQ
jgi:Dolichyl-phosphate-mannose-protein mannosyltransferase